MIKKTVYEAFDGKQFEDQTECEEYEFDTKYKTLNKNHIKMWNENKHLIPPDRWVADFEGAYYIKCTTQVECEYIRDLGEITNISNPFRDRYDYRNNLPQGGFWYYDAYNDNWIEYIEAKQEFDDIWSGLE